MKPIDLTERAVINLVCNYPDAMEVAMESIDVNCFFNENYQVIYQKAVEITKANKTTDLVTMARELAGVIQVSYLAELMGEFQNKNAIQQHCLALQESAMIRSQLKMANEIVKQAQSDDADPFEINETINGYASDFSGRIKTAAEIPFANQIDELHRTMELAGQNKGLSGVPTGFTKLDSFYGGRQNGDLIIKAGRPAMGKTAQALAECLHMAMNNYPVLFISLEMPSLQITQRLLSIVTNIPLETIRNGSFTDFQWREVHEGLAKLKSSKMSLVDASSISMQELEVIATRNHRVNGVKCIYVDYLQLIRPSKDGNKGRNREQEVSEVSRGLKQLAKKLSVPVVALAQLSRAVETRGGDKVPSLSDLRESGSLEQDADIVEFLYRPEYYGIKETPEGESTYGLGMVIVAKNRNGRTGEITLNFIHELAKFENKIADLPKPKMAPSNFFDKENDVPF